MIEDFKGEMNTSFKEIKKKTKKKLEEMNKACQQSQGKKNKQMKVVNKAVQDLKKEAIKKTVTEGVLEMVKT